MFSASLLPLLAVAAGFQDPAAAGPPAGRLPPLVYSTVGADGTAAARLNVRDLERFAEGGGPLARDAAMTGLLAAAGAAKAGTPFAEARTAALTAEALPLDPPRVRGPDVRNRLADGTVQYRRRFLDPQSMGAAPDPGGPTDAAEAAVFRQKYWQLIDLRAHRPAAGETVPADPDRSTLTARPAAPRLPPRPAGDLTNADVAVDLGYFGATPRLTVALAGRRGDTLADARERLLALLTDPDRYAAAHLGLLEMPGDTAIYGGSDWAAAWHRRDGLPDPPADWAGRLFYFGMEYRYEEDGGFVPVRPAENAARLARYWAEYFDGARTDFRVAPEPPGLTDPRAIPADPPPLRPADDPLPAR